MVDPRLQSPSRPSGKDTASEKSEVFEKEEMLNLHPHVTHVSASCRATRLTMRGQAVGIDRRKKIQRERERETLKRTKKSAVLRLLRLFSCVDGSIQEWQH